MLTPQVGRSESADLIELALILRLLDLSAIADAAAVMKSLESTRAAVCGAFGDALRLCQASASGADRPSDSPGASEAHNAWTDGAQLSSA